jgi:hypothetical protein
MGYATGGRTPAVNPINMTMARARDFRAHYPLIARQIDEWNRLATGYSEASTRFQGLTYRETEKAFGGKISNGLPQLLGPLGQGDLDASAIVWQYANQQVEASWTRNFFNEPAWLTIIDRSTSGITEADLLRVWEVISAFPDLTPVSEWRTRLQGARRLRPLLLDALEHAEIAVELKGKCGHCPP